MYATVSCLLALILATAGCATGLGIAGMSAEQLEQVVKIKDATASCVRGVYAGVLVTATWVSADKGVPAGMTIDENCKITFAAPPPTK